VFGRAGPVSPQTARRLACDAALTRAVCTRHPDTGSPDTATGHPDTATGHHKTATGHPATVAGHPDTATVAGHPDTGHQDLATDGPDTATGHPDTVAGGPDGLARRLRDGLALLPPALGGAPSEVLELGRTTRVVSAGLRKALAVRDGGCVVAGCDRPPAWCDAHHLRHWLHGGPTNLDNLVLVCRAHHRAVHEGHQHLARGPTGHHTLTGPRPPQPTPA